MFDRWGRFVYRRRWATLIVSAVLLGLSVAGIITGGTLAGNGGFGANLAAGQAAKLISRETQPGQAVTGSSMELIFSSDTLNATDPAFQSAVESALAPLRADSRVTAIDSPYTVPAIAQSSYLSKDSRKALVIVHFRDASLTAQGYVNRVVAAIDYSLFVVNRFRDELADGASREDAIATSLSTAGRAITFSGITVAVGLSAMLFFQGTFLASMGAAGAIVVAVAVVYGLTFLPALLSVIGPSVDRLRLPFLGRRRPAGAGAWHSMALWVMRRPWVVLVPALGVLLLAGTPFLQLRLANGDVDQLPPRNEARQGYDTLVKDFPGYDQTTITAVVDYPDGNPLTADHVGALYDLARRLAALPNVIHVQSIVNLDPSLSRAEYQRLYSGPATELPSEMQQALQLGAGKHIVLINLVTNKPYTSDEARAIVNAVRAEGVPDAQVLATGSTAFDLDIVNYIL